jgi:hypothetical protein
MKTLGLFLGLAGLAVSALHAQTSDLAPANLSSVIFNGTITGGNGGANGNGTISSLFTSSGVDYSLNGDGTLSDPVPFTYTKTGANTARVTEGASGSLPSVSVAMTFTSATSGTFVATYGNNSTQSGSFTLAPIAFTSPLVNVSTRTTLAANGSAITGFVVGGSGPRRVLIRAVGPGLTQFGVTGALTNPQIMLWRGTTMIGQNDDFSSGGTVDATLPAQFTRVGAFGLTNGSRDAAMIATLDPGSYTAQIRGGTATETGEVLLEVYFLD